MKLPLFTFDLANNHMGVLAHGISIINHLSVVCGKFDFNFALKFQYRNLSLLIHPKYKKDFSYKYIKRFIETNLVNKDRKRLVNVAKDKGFITMCTPFDEQSVALCEDHGIDILKIASCSFTDWPLIEQIGKLNKPIIASTAGASIEDIDSIVSYFTHRGKDFALMHCVAEYPTLRDKTQLNQIDLFKDRYPKIPIGYSAHEDPDNLGGIRMAIAKGAELFEKHVGIPTYKYPLNKYSATPEQIEYWCMAAEEAYEACGIVDRRTDFTDQEIYELRSLGRGVWAKDNISEGTLIQCNNTFLAIPQQEGQVSANDLSKYTEFYAALPVEKDSPILYSQIRKIDNQDRILEIVKKIREVISKSGIFIPSRLDLQISHHYGLDKFEEYGCTLIDYINREYCKKLIIILPNQKHPEQYHNTKEETFHILYGDVFLFLNDVEYKCSPGTLMTVERGVRHSFSSKGGAVIEEISSTHLKEDSFYTDPTIINNSHRKTEITNWGINESC